MIDYEGLRLKVAKGLKEYLDCPVIRSNQNEKPPAYPYVVYTITTLKSQNKGTHGVYSDGKDRKPVTQTWSISALSSDNAESIMLADKASEWLDRVGTLYLNDNGVVVQSVGSITNRDNILTTDYEYKNGFDVVFSLVDVIDNPYSEEYIEAATVGSSEIEKEPTTDELNEMLESRLSGD